MCVFEPGHLKMTGKVQGKILRGSVVWEGHGSIMIRGFTSWPSDHWSREADEDCLSPCWKQSKTLYTSVVDDEQQEPRSMTEPGISIWGGGNTGTNCVEPEWCNHHTHLSLTEHKSPLHTTCLPKWPEGPNTPTDWSVAHLWSPSHVGWGGWVRHTT